MLKNGLVFLFILQLIFIELTAGLQAKAAPKFSISKDTICVNESIVISDFSIGTITTYQWNFGNGAMPLTASGKGPFYVKYTSAGYKKITLTLNGDTTIVKDSILFVRPTPQAQLIVNDTDQCLPSNIFFMSSNTIFSGTYSNKWILGDGNTILNKNITYSYNQSGNYLVKMVSYTNFCRDTAQLNINVFQKPVAKFKVESEKVCLNDNHFKISNTTKNKNKFNTIFFLGDGNGRLDDNFSYHYDIAGNYTIFMKVGLGNDCEDTIGQLVSVFENPKSIFTISNQFQCLNGNSFVFNNLSQNATNYKWLFGDNNISNSYSPNYSYILDGSFKVQLITNTLNNCLDTSFNFVTVYPKPNALFTINDTAQCFSDNLFNFTAISNIKNGAIENSWILPNGNKITKDNILQHFDVSGNLSITLIAKSDRDCRDTLIRNILVYKEINPFFNIETIDLETKRFTALEKPNYNFYWKISDGSSYSQQDFSHTFLKNDSFFISLLVLDENGCQDSSFYFFKINSPALKTFNNANNFYLYPNPTSGKINFKLELKQSDFIEYKITNSIGQVIVSNKINNLSKGIYFYDFNFNDGKYSKGTYTLSIITSQGKIIEKILFQ